MRKASDIALPLVPTLHGGMQTLEVEPGVSVDNVKINIQGQAKAFVLFNSFTFFLKMILSSVVDLQRQEGLNSS